MQLRGVYVRYFSYTESQIKAQPVSGETCVSFPEQLLS